MGFNDDDGIIETLVKIWEGREEVHTELSKNQQEHWKAGNAGRLIQLGLRLSYNLIER